MDLSNVTVPTHRRVSLLVAVLTGLLTVGGLAVAPPSSTTAGPELCCSRGEEPPA